MKSFKLSKNIVFFFLFMISSLLFHNKSYNQAPSKVHGWAQSDHYALALGFIDNNFDFFHPKTYTLNHQFKPKKELINPKGITAIDFPIFHFTVALIMKALNSTDFWIFRFLMLFWSFISLFFLFRTINKLKGFWEALLISSFIMMQPIYAYYQNGFHISMAAFSCLLIGFSYLLKHLYSKKNLHFIFSVLFLTLAALIRFTEIIFLIALFSAMIISIWKSKKINFNILWVFLGFSFVLSYFIYNKYLANQYGTVFLNKPLIADDVNSLFRHFTRQAKMYLRGFLPLLHFVLLGILFYFYKNHKKTEPKIDFLKLVLLFLFVGTAIFNLLMSWSLSIHDYYSIDTWLPVILALITYLVFSSNFKEKTIMPIITILFITGALSLTTETQHWKYKYFERKNDILMNDFKESLDLLKQINTKDSVLIIAEDGWNTPMIYWQRNAFRITSKYAENIPAFLKTHFDYIITQDREFNNTVLKEYPKFNTKVSKIDSNGKITIWKQLNN